MPSAGSPRSGGPSRRTVLLGAGAAVVVVAGGGTAALALRPENAAAPARGALVGPLLAKKAFTIAHRGGSRDWPEESLYAYQQSVAAGVDALDVSLARSSDGVWFGLHDPTLDRTSGTFGLVASKYPWSDIRNLRIKPTGTQDPSQPLRPYARLDEICERYGSTHSLFIDPKAVDKAFYPELLTLVEKHTPDLTQSVIAKGYCTSLDWARAARRRGCQTWGYYYADELAQKPTLLNDTQDYWSLLGLDWRADKKSWALVKSFGKPVVAHVVPNAEAAETALSHGAAGLMISGVSETLPGLRAERG